MLDLSKTIITPNARESAEDIKQLVDHYANRLLDGKNKLLAGGDSNTKLAKNGHVESIVRDWQRKAGASVSIEGVETRGLSLAPSTIAGAGDICPFASDGCRRSCLYFCGRGGSSMVQAGRIARTQLWRYERGWFLETLSRELAAAEAYANKRNKLLAVRLNVLSDIPWETQGIIEQFPSIQFYDYSKWPTRYGSLLPNYWVTFSLNEDNEESAINVLKSGGNVAIAFADRDHPYVGNRSKYQQLPKSWRGFRVVDGDETDLRFADVRGRKTGRVIGLRLKALSLSDRQSAIASGFAIEF